MKSITQTTINEINSLHADCEGLLRTGISKGIRIGELLTECKDQLPHGDFTRWVTENFTFSSRTARNYMRLFDNREKLTGVSNISQAYQLLKTENVSGLESGGRQPELESDTRVSDLGTMSEQELLVHLKELEDAHQKATAQLLVTRRALGKAINELPELTPDDEARIDWLRELLSIRPGIAIYQRTPPPAGRYHTRRMVAGWQVVGESTI